VQSFDFRTLEAMKRRNPRVRLSALFEPRETGDLVKRTLEAGAAILSPHFRLVTPELVAAAHAARLQVVPWTANEPALWEKLAAAGVDAIISDDPAALLAWLKQRKLR
jgi:glycerophosphoryl diester phosphodiesterase